MNARLTFEALLAASALLVAGTAWADGECSKGYRQVTPAERSTMTHVLETARGALPAAPAGWAVISDDRISVPASYCRDRDPKPWSYSFTRHYSNHDPARQQAGERAMADAAAAAQAEQAKKQPRLDALMARMTALNQQLVAAAQKGDQARVDQLSIEIDKVTSEYQRVADEGSAAAQIQQAGAVMQHDLEMAISVDVNPTRAGTTEATTKLAPPPGAQLATRWNTTREAITDGHALVLLGQWKRAADGHGWIPAVPANAAQSQPYSIAVRINADPDRIEQTVRSIDFASISKALQR